MYLTQTLHRAAQQYPDRPMTVYGDRVRTTAETADRVARLAGALTGLGVREGDRVGIMALNSDIYHEYFFATWWAGAAVNPVNIRWSAAEVAFSLVDSGTRVLLIDDRFAPLAPEIRAAVPDLDTVIFCGDGPTPDGMLSYEELIAATEPASDPRRGGEAMAGIFYTGGTTGRPKGVVLTHDNLLVSGFGAVTTGRTNPEYGRALVTAPLFHLAALANWVGQGLLDATMVFTGSFDPGQVLRLIETERITSVLLVPTMLQMLVRHPDLAARDLSSMAVIQYGASPITPTLLRAVQAAFPAADLTQGYGMTEAGPGVSSLGAADHRAGHKLESAGRPMRHAEIRIVGPDDTELPRGEVGEITTRSSSVMVGYWNRPEETAAALRDGWLHTGDAGYLDDEGYLFVVDRIKDMIITGGENVYSAEVESALATHSDILQCAVIALPDERYGERVHAVLVVRPGAELDVDAVRAHCKPLIAGYKAPRSISIVDEMPTSPAGKILKRDLRTTYAAAVAAN